MRLSTPHMWVILCVFLVGASFTTLEASPPEFPNVYAFGDSLTDTGNLLALIIGNQYEPPKPPDLVLNLSLGRFSNGPLYIEYLASRFASPQDAMPFFAGLGSNFAIAGSITFPEPDLLGFPNRPSFLGAQVEAFLQANQGAARPDALFVIFAGANDVFVLMDAVPPEQLPAALQQAALNVLSAVRVLSNAGARNFLLVNVPNIGLTPRFKSLGKEKEGAQASLTFNFALLTNLLGQHRRLPGKLWHLDSFAISQLIAYDAKLFRGRLTGITDADTPCALVDPNPQDCPGMYFWDGIHPTTAAHKIVADAAVALLRLRPLISNRP